MKTKIPSKKEIEKDFKEWKSVGAKKIAQIKARNKALKERKEEKFTARMSTADFLGLQKEAEKKGIGYQTLLGMVVHQYVNGQLVDLAEVQKVLPSLKLKKAAGW